MRAILSLFALLVLTAGAGAYTHAKLYDFCGQAGCTDGASPTGGLVADAAGNLYGMTYEGGRFGADNKGGTVFALIKGADGFTMQTLHNFCAKPACADGSLPSGQGLIADTDGNLYGTTTFGGAHGHGIAFKLAHDAGRTHWTLSVLHDFCSVMTGDVCTDGAWPSGLTYAGEKSGLPYNGRAPLYGVTADGGTEQFTGLAYRLTRARGGWTETVMYNFCQVRRCNDGANPIASLTVDTAGRIFGVTVSGGQVGRRNEIHTYGTVFKIKRDGADSWKYLPLYSFCRHAKCTDGKNPYVQLTLDGDGNLIGTTQLGGDRAGGLVFKLTPGGPFNSTLATLYGFCAEAGCPDGNQPMSPLLAEDGGSYLGTTFLGGKAREGGGVAYRLSGTSEAVLHVFCTISGCKDGAGPQGRLVKSPGGHIYGITMSGGDHKDRTVAPDGGGTVYELTPD